MKKDEYEIQAAKTEEITEMLSSKSISMLIALRNDGTVVFLEPEDDKGDKKFNTPVPPPVTGGFRICCKDNVYTRAYLIRGEWRCFPTAMPCDPEDIDPCGDVICS